MQIGLVGSYSFFFPSEVRKAMQVSVSDANAGPKCQTLSMKAVRLFTVQKTKHMSGLLGVLQVSTCP